MRSIRNILLFGTLFALVAAMLTPKKGETLPLFARKYSMPCTQCHMAFPRLNKFGMAFRQNGYRLPSAKGESPWESGNFPLSLVGNVGYAFTSLDTADTGTGRRSSTSFGGFVQNAVEFHTAGTLAEHVTFHFDNGFATDTGVLESGMAFVQFDDLAKDGALNLKAGIFDAEIPYLADSRKTTLHEYLSPVTLDGRGIEVNGTHASLTYAAGLINSGRDPLNAKPGSKSFNQLENVYAWVMHDIHGQLVTARVYLDQQDPRTAGKSTSQHLQAELSAALGTERLLVIPGFTYEKYADLAAAGEDVKLNTGLLEALAFLDKDNRWLLTGRIEVQSAPKTSVTSSASQNLGVLNLSYFVNPNAKVALEWAHNGNNTADPRSTEFNAYVHVGY